MITVFLTAEDHSRIYRAVQSEADAASRIRTSKVVRFDYPAAERRGNAPTDKMLAIIFAITNGVADTTEQREAERQYRADGETRSLSVGDIVDVPGRGLFAVDPTGWRELTHPWTGREATDHKDAHIAEHGMRA
jgi:hypothetical protein